MSSAESIAVEFELASLQVKSGDEVVLVAIAADAYFMDGQHHEHARSAPRRLRIVGDAAVAEELRAGLASIRRTAIRLEGEQADIEANMADKGTDDSSSQSQARLGDRITSTAEALDALAQRRDRNRLEDASLMKFSNNPRTCLLLQVVLRPRQHRPSRRQTMRRTSKHARKPNNKRPKHRKPYVRN